MNDATEVCRGRQSQLALQKELCILFFFFFLYSLLQHSDVGHVHHNNQSSGNSMTSWYADAVLEEKLRFVKKKLLNCAKKNESERHSLIRRSQ